jgi:hypothetical protein
MDLSDLSPLGIKGGEAASLSLSECATFRADITWLDGSVALRNRPPIIAVTVDVGCPVSLRDCPERTAEATLLDRSLALSDWPDCEASGCLAAAVLLDGSIVLGG